MDEFERLNREMERRRVQRTDEAALPKLFCVRGHIQPLGQHNIANRCHKCADVLVSQCTCGEPFDLRYEFKPEYVNRVVAGRDICTRCQRITPWTARWLFRASDKEFSLVELELLRHVEGHPQ